MAKKEMRDEPPSKYLLCLELVPISKATKEDLQLAIVAALQLLKPLSQKGPISTVRANIKEAKRETKPWGKRHVHRCIHCTEWICDSSDCDMPLMWACPSHHKLRPKKGEKGGLEDSPK